MTVKRNSFLANLDQAALESAQRNTSKMAKSLNAENHKHKKPSIVPAILMSEDALAIRVSAPLHKLLKSLAVDEDSDLQTSANEAIYELLVKKGKINPKDYEVSES